MKLLYGTGNEAKLAAMKSRLAPLGIKLYGLNALEQKGIAIPEVVEDGNSPLENARKKAVAYYEAFGVPVFSVDTGMYFEGVPDALQPGRFVRTVHGKRLSDEEMMVYYSDLARRYAPLIGWYQNAVCYIGDETHSYERMDESLESRHFLLTPVSSDAVLRKGFPLDSMSKDLENGNYFYALPQEYMDKIAVPEGFLDFFKPIVTKTLEGMTE